jgi:hypothetical protein
MKPGWAAAANWSIEFDKSWSDFRAAALLAVAEHYNPEEIGALLSLIVTINAWNALSVASRAWAPERREA